MSLSSVPAPGSMCQRVSWIVVNSAPVAASWQRGRVGGAFSVARALTSVNVSAPSAFVAVPIG